MEAMAGNPIIEIWRESLRSGGGLDAAREAVAARARAGDISREHINQVGAFVESEKAKADLPGDARILLAALLFEAAETHPSLDDQLHFATRLTLWQAIPGGRPDLLRLNAEAAQAALARPPADLPEAVKASLLGDLGASLAQLGERREAVALLQQALAIYRKRAKAEPAAFEPDVAGTLNNLGNVLRALGDRDAARQAYEEAVAQALTAEPFLQARVRANLAGALYDAGERGRGIKLARTAVEMVEIALSDSRQADVRYSFKEEIEGAYRLLLCDPKLTQDTLRAHRVVEALREGETLAGFGGWRSGLLAIQRSHDGVVFLINLPTGTRFETGDASWVNAGRRLLEEVLKAEETTQDRRVQIAAAGRELWEATPEFVREVLASPPGGGVALSLDPVTGLLPLEMMSPTGKPEDFLCVAREMPRAPGERLFRDCLDRSRMNWPAGDRALVFGNPRHTRKSKDAGYAPNLPGAQKEACDLAVRFADRGFKSAVNGRMAWLGADAWRGKFVQGLEASPGIIHFSGHGATINEEECLLFAGDGALFADELLNQAKPLSHHPFVFLNSCLSGRARARGGAFRGLPIAFLRLGAAAVVASVFILFDQPAASFARIFYEKLFTGETAGDAMLHTRQELFKDNCLHWGRPILYGNPHARLELPSKL